MTGFNKYFALQLMSVCLRLVKSFKVDCLMRAAQVYLLDENLSSAIVNLKGAVLSESR